MQLGHESTPYKKKSSKKRVKKSDHKHEYEKVIGIYTFGGEELVGPAEECVVCGKVNITSFGFFYEDCGKWHRVLGYKEVKEKYPDMREVRIKI